MKKGEIKLTNMQFKRELFLLKGFNIEIIDSMIDEIYIYIPWKQIKTEVTHLF